MVQPSSTSNGLAPASTSPYRSSIAFRPFSRLSMDPL